MRFVQLGNQFVDGVVVLDAAGSPVDADATPVLRVFADGGTEIDMTGNYDCDSGATGYYVVRGNVHPDFEIGVDYTAFVECEIDSVLVATPLPSFSSFRVSARDPGNLVEQLERRHGQGAWGPRYDSPTDDDSSPAAYVIPYGAWDVQYSFELRQPSGAVEPFFSGTDLAVVDGATILDGKGMMGPADSAASFPDGGIGSGNSDALVATAYDVTTDDIAIAVAFQSDVAEGPYVSKETGAHGYFLGMTGGALNFSCYDGSAHSCSVTGLSDSLARGCVVIAALSKSTDKIRIGVMTRNGALSMSDLTDVTGLGSLTNVADFKVSAYGAGVLISQLALGLGSGAATGVPENLEACLRAYHASVFGSAEAVRELVGVPAGATVSADIAAIDSKTTNLPSDPADESLIIAATDAVMARLGSPAGASIAADIAAIPTNPLLDDDARLDHLDADISSVGGGGDTSRLNGLLHENALVDKQDYDSDGNLISARVRVFADATAAGAASAWNGASPADDAEGETQRYVVTATYAAGRLKSYKLVRSL